MRRGVHALTVHQQVQIRIAGHAIDAEGELAGAAGEAEIGQLVRLCVEISASRRLLVR
jgi:hypothetical protein